jgi:hypothetical protein
MNLSRAHLTREHARWIAAARGWRIACLRLTPYARAAYHECLHLAAEYRRALAGAYGQVQP